MTLICISNFSNNPPPPPPLPATTPLSNRRRSRSFSLPVRQSCIYFCLFFGCFSLAAFIKNSSFIVGRRATKPCHRGIRCFIHGFSPSRVPEFSSSCLARYQEHKNLRHVIKTGVMAVENRWQKLCRSSVRWLWLFVRQNALFSSWYCWAYRQEWIKVSGQYSAR